MTDDRAEPAPVAMGKVSSVLALVLVAGSFAWALDLYRDVFGLLLNTEQFLAGMMAVGMPLLFLTLPARRHAPRNRAPLYDIIAAVASAAAMAYVSIRYPVIGDLVAERPIDGLIAGSVAIVLVIEGLRRTAGPVLTGVVICFIAYTLVGQYVPGVMQAMRNEPLKVAYYLAWSPGSMLGFPLLVATTIVIAFVFMGRLLFQSGGGEFFTDLAVAATGRYRGGSAKIAVTASALFGSISGTAVSNVVSTGVVTIPLMRQSGYSGRNAAAIEAVASTGGQLMPPIMGSAAFLIAEFLQITYAEVMIAAVVPAVLYYAALFMMADLEAARAGIAPIDRARVPALWPVLKRGWFFPIPFAVLIFSLFSLNFSPERSALYGSASLILLAGIFGYKGRRLTARDILDTLRDAGTSALDIMMITACAGFIIGSLNVSGLGFSLTFKLVEFASGNLWLLLLIAAIVCIVLGLGLPTVAVYVLLATLVAPSLIELGVQPIAAHLFVMYFGMMSMITPPVAIAAFAAASIAKSEPMMTGFAAMRFGWVAYLIPFLFILSPDMLLQGTALGATVAVVTALVGIWLISAGVSGYGLRRMGPVKRIGFAIAGLMLLTPAQGFPGAVTVEIAGAIAAVVLVALELISRRVAARVPVADN